MSKSLYLHQLEKVLHQTYLAWDMGDCTTWRYTHPERLRPVLGVSGVIAQDQTEWARISFYAELFDEEAIAYKDFPIETPVAEIMAFIAQEFASPKWFLLPYFACEERQFHLATPLESLHLKLMGDRISLPYHVFNDESICEAVLCEIAVEADDLEIGEWYSLQFGNDELEFLDYNYEAEEDGHLLSYLENADWLVGLSTPTSDSFSWEVDFLPDGLGFAFRNNDAQKKRLWFHLAWLPINASTAGQSLDKLNILLL